MEVLQLLEGWWTVECDLVVMPLFQDSVPSCIPDGRLKSLIEEMIDSSEWKGGPGDLTVVHCPPGTRTARLALLGLGQKGDYHRGRLVRSLMVLLRRLSRAEIPRLGIVCGTDEFAGAGLKSLVEGVVLGSFNPGIYRSKNSQSTRVGKLLVFSGPEGVAGDVLQESAQASIVAEAANLARELTFEPGNSLTPERFAAVAGEIAAQVGLEFRVLDLTELERRGLNGILAVSQGSSCSPRLVVLKHSARTDDSPSPIALVGKGVTFDSGGISLKPAQSMEEMKTDKAGACAVLGAMKAIAELSLPAEVVGVIPLVENMPGGNAQRPGDVIRTLSGKTVEVINTDAEGRLILADALTYVLQEYDPACLIDIATLTGACVVALGHLRAGLFSNDDWLASLMETSANEAGEGLWRLPLDPEYREELDSKIADLKNVGGRWGGAIVAAKFLQEFVENRPWCHVDMAGVDLFRGEDLAGPTGFGVRTLVEFVRRWPVLPGERRSAFRAT